jgi:flagellar motor switch protein FliN/FliY
MTPPEERASEHARWLMEQWSGALAAAIESMTEQRPEVSFTPGPAPEAAAVGTEGAAFSWEQGFKDIPQPALWVTAPEKTWLELGQRTLRSAGIDAAEPADARNTYLEILSQSLATLAQHIGARLGKEVACERGGERVPAGPAAQQFRATLRYPEAELALEVRLSAALMDALERGAESNDEPAGTAQVPAALPPPDAPAPASSKTLDLLLDVDLPVSVSFGRTQLPIKEILKLTTGSIVELNRSLSEPVEVIVSNCIVARGEVVVIEGNYGVRIHQIMSRQDRLRSLK